MSRLNKHPLTYIRTYLLEIIGFKKTLYDLKLMLFGKKIIVKLRTTK